MEDSRVFGDERDEGFGVGLDVDFVFGCGSLAGGLLMLEA